MAIWSPQSHIWYIIWFWQIWNFATKNSEPLVVAVVKKSVFSAFGQVMWPVDSGSENFCLSSLQATWSSSPTRCIVHFFEHTFILTLIFPSLKLWPLSDSWKIWIPHKFTCGFIQYKFINISSAFTPKIQKFSHFYTFLPKKLIRFSGTFFKKFYLFIKTGFVNSQKIK